MDCPNCSKEKIIQKLPHDVPLQENVTALVFEGRNLESLDDVRDLCPSHVITSPNRIPDEGRRYLADLLKGVISAPQSFSVGTDGTATTDGDTALRNEVHRDTISQRLNITNGLKIRSFLPSSAANGNTLQEVGIFQDASTSTGKILARDTHTSIVKDASKAVQYDWDFTFSTST